MNYAEKLKGLKQENNKNESKELFEQLKSILEETAKGDNSLTIYSYDNNNGLLDAMYSEIKNCYDEFKVIIEGEGLKVYRHKDCSYWEKDSITISW